MTGGVAWSGDAMVLGKHPVLGPPADLDAGGGSMDFFPSIIISLLSTFLWKTA